MEGEGCTCYARHSGECGCTADWSSYKETIAQEVFDALKEDGYYGEYTLGPDLWARFVEAYSPEKVDE